jgi:hypothetical protein
MSHTSPFYWLITACVTMHTALVIDTFGIPLLNSLLDLRAAAASLALILADWLTLVLIVGIH